MDFNKKKFDIFLLNFIHYSTIQVKYTKNFKISVTFKNKI